MFYVGIDPGITGAIAVLDKAGMFAACYDMPSVQRGKTTRNEVNAPGVAQILKAFTANDVVAGLERVSSMPGQGISSTFSFGDSFGVVRGVCGALGIPVFYLAPASWKRFFKLTGTEKDAARGMAISIFPRAQLHLKKHIGRADALLMALYTFKHYQGLSV